MKNIANAVKKTFTEKYLFPLYSFLFIFSTVNREFLLFGIDLRYILLPLGLFLLIKNAFSNTAKIERKEKDPVYAGLIALFVWCLVSNISWLWNGLDIKLDQMINQNILIINSLLAVMVYRRYRRLVDNQMIKKTMVLSCFVLLLSFILTGMGYTLDQISGSEVRSMSVSTETVEQNNLFGGDTRLAGYAEDANYASVLLVLGIVSALQLKHVKMRWKIVAASMFLVALGYACSRTVLIALIVGVMYLPVLKMSKNKTEIFAKNANRLLIAMIFIIAFTMPRLGMFSSMSTMSTRYSLWNVAEEQFTKSPIIGSGISSSRSAINTRYGGFWYVQPHSNYWQLLAETGLIGIVLFAVFSSRCLNEDKKTGLDKMSFMIILVFGITFEIIQLQMFVYAAYIAMLNKEANK